MRLSTLYLLSLSVCWATTTATIDQNEVSATQAIIRVHTDQAGNCLYRASEDWVLGAVGKEVLDVFTGYFPGSNSDARPGSIPGSIISTVLSNHVFVIGTRGQPGAQLGSDNFIHSLVLEQDRNFVVGATCGSDAEVVIKSRTVNPPSGVVYREPRFYRPSPGDYAYPSVPWTSRGFGILDPETGANVKLAALPGDFLSNNAVSTQTFQPNLVGGSGWFGSGQSWSYSGISQGTIFLPATPVSTSNGTTSFSIQSTSGPNEIAIVLTLSGSAPSIHVCLTADGGQNCAGGQINQPITSTPTIYGIGDTAPVLSAWRNGSRPPLSRADIVPRSGTVTKAGTIVTLTGGDTFLASRWVAGSTITLGSSVCVIASIQSDQALTVTNTLCASDATNIPYAASNFGFILQVPTAANVTAAISSPSWIVVTSGYAAMPASGEYNDVCQIVSVTGPTGPGNLCAPAYGVGAPNNYNTGNPMYWIGQDGTVNMIGLSIGATTPSGFSDGLMDGTLVFDGLVGGRIYGAKPTVAGKYGIFYIQYSGGYGATNPNFGDVLPSSVSSSITTDLNALVASFDSSGQFAAFTTAAQAIVSVCPCWNIVAFQENGTHGALQLESKLNNQDSIGWMATYSLDSNTIIAAVCSYCGAGGTLNRWMGMHTSIGTRKYQTLVANNSLRPGGLGGVYGVNTTGTLGGSGSWTACPGTFGSSGNNCSVITLASLTPTDPLGNAAPGVGGSNTVKLGDYFEGDGECEQIVALTSFTATVWRNRWTQFSGFGLCTTNTTGHSANLHLNMHTSSSAELIWAWGTDPTGIALTLDPLSADCHFDFTLDAEIMGCLVNTAPVVPGKPIRLGPFPANATNPVFMVNFDALFSNRWAPSHPALDDNFMETHPSKSQETAPVSEQTHFIDNRPYMGFGYPASGVTKVGTYLYLIPSASLPNYNYRVRPWGVFSGRKIAVDVSGPGSVLHDTTADNYKFCMVLLTNECVSGSTVGNVYVNFPFVSTLFSSNCRSGQFTNNVMPVNDIDIAEWQDGMQGIQEVAIDRGNDPDGKGVRFLTSAFSQKCSQSVFWNSREVAPGGWVFTTVDLLDGVNSQPILIRKPPSPPTTSTNLADFIPVTFQFGGGTTGDTMVVRWGYREYDQNSLALGNVPPCNPRNEACNSDGSGALPFVWSSETQHGTTCSAGCTVTANVLPAPGGRVLYFKRIRTNGAVSVAGPLEIVMVK